jgi:hypothetical protein
MYSPVRISNQSGHYPALILSLDLDLVSVFPLNSLCTPELYPGIPEYLPL